MTRSNDLLVHLGVMAKYWCPGRVKTRLGRALGMELAAEVHRTLCLHLAHVLKDIATTRSFVIDPPQRHNDFKAALPDGWRVEHQSAGDLGQRMRAWFDRSVRDAGWLQAAGEDVAGERQNDGGQNDGGQNDGGQNDGGQNDGGQNDGGLDDGGGDVTGEQDEVVGGTLGDGERLWQGGAEPWSECRILIGADCPFVTPAVIGQAVAHLQTHRVVLGPASDGGYYLIGLRGGWCRQYHALMIEMPWSTDTVFAETCRRAADNGLSIATLDELNDIDTMDDLTHAMRRLNELATQSSIKHTAYFELRRTLQGILASGGHA